MTRYIFDAEPLLGYLYDEPGADAVADRLRAVQDDVATGLLSHATAVEVIYKVARLETGRPNVAEPGEAELDVGKHDLRVFRGFGLTIETPSCERVARVKASGGISLGEADAVAWADETGGTLVVGSDPEFDDLPVDIGIDRIQASD